jgi:signal transduction histidine kinase
VDDLDTTIKDIRSAIFALHAHQDADGPGLRARVLAEVQAAADALGFAPTLRMEGLLDTRVPDRHAEQVLAAVRETLSNVARHAQATSVEVSLGVNGNVVLRVQDNGVGIQAGGRRSGLRNLADRAAELGGALRVEPASGGGTVVEWHAPVKP